MKKSDPYFFIPFDKDTFIGDKCFLCGIHNSDKNSKEHIFPKWLQRRFDLQDERLTLLNDTKILYKKLTVACCEECNTNHLSAMEIRFQRLLNRSFSNLSLDDELTIFQWTSKILYATLYKEASMKNDRSKAHLGEILKPEVIERFSALHLTLQSIRIPTKITKPFPCSIFVFTCKDEGYHYLNSIEHLSMAFKFGKIGICITLQDNNKISCFLEKLRTLENYPLSFIQFLEVATNIFYAASLKVGAPLYITNYGLDSGRLTINTSGHMRFREWSKKEFGEQLDFTLRRHNLFDGTKTYQSEINNTLTYLVDRDGVPLIEKA